MSTAIPSVADLITDSPERQAFLRFARLTAKKRALKDEIEEIENQLRVLEPQLLTYLGEGGYQKVRVEGYTISPHREPWVYPAQGQSREAVCQALKASGLGQFVKEQWSTSALTKYVRDLEEAYEDALAEGSITIRDVLPRELANVIRIEPTYRVQAIRRR